MNQELLGLNIIWSSILGNRFKIWNRDIEKYDESDTLYQTEIVKQKYNRHFFSEGAGSHHFARYDGLIRAVEP